MDRDKRHLKILSIVQIIYGCVMLLFTTIGSLWVYRIFNDLVNEMNKELPLIVGAITMGMAMLMVWASLIFEICIILMGQFLVHYKRYKFCFYMALIECVNVPLGTIIGVSTILILRRDSVKELFTTSEEERGFD